MSRISFHECIYPWMFSISENLFSTFCRPNRVYSYPFSPTSFYHNFLYLSHPIVSQWLPLIFHLTIIFCCEAPLSLSRFFLLPLSVIVSSLCRATSYWAQWPGGGGEGWQPILCPFDNWRQQEWLHLQRPVPGNTHHSGQGAHHSQCQPLWVLLWII